MGAWAGAASALVEASRLSPTRPEREQRLLQAMDAMVGAGDLVQANAFAGEIVVFPAGPMRDAALGYLAVLRGRPAEAEDLLRRGWQQADPVPRPAWRPSLRQRWALHSVGRLRGADIVDWADRAIKLAAPGEPVTDGGGCVARAGARLVRPGSGGAGGIRGRPRAGDSP